MKNISKQYQDLLEGNMSRDNFVRSCRQQFPQYISPVTSIDDAIKILKSKRIIAESISENMDYKDPYVKGYIDNENGRSLDDCPYDERRDAMLWKNGWMDAETEKQMDHDEDTYNRETGGYGDLYKESLNEAEKTEGRWKEATGQGQYDRFKDLDNVNFTTFLRAVAFEVSKDPIVDDNKLPAIMDKVAKAMKKDPMAYRDLVISNTEEIKKQDETRKMKEVKPGNMIDKDNGMKEIKGQEKYKADSAPKTEYKKGKPAGVKEMGVTPKKAPGIKAVMDIPGKEKVLDQLKESLKKSLTEDTHYKYTPGKEVDTPDGPGVVIGIMGGTITVQLHNGQEGDYQINVLDAIEAKKQQDNVFNSMPDLGSVGQKWLSSQVKEDEKLEKENVTPKKKDKYSKLREFLKKALKKEAIKFKAGGETIFKNNSEAGSYEADLKKAGVKYTKTNV
jgi:ribosome modulation factor